MGPCPPSGNCHNRKPSATTSNSGTQVPSTCEPKHADPLYPRDREAWAF
jgi:hypothetical protein